MANRKDGINRNNGEVVISIFPNHTGHYENYGNLLVMFGELEDLLKITRSKAYHAAKDENVIIKFERNEFAGSHTVYIGDEYLQGFLDSISKETNLKIGETSTAKYHKSKRELAAEAARS